MAEPLKISTSGYAKEGKVEVDGQVWTVRLPGAGTELRMSQSFRNSKLYAARIGLIDKKIENGTATEEDLDKYERYCQEFEKNEREVFEFFSAVYKDDTEDNSEVKKWLEETPTAIIQMAFEDIKKAADGTTEKPADEAKAE